MLSKDDRRQLSEIERCLEADDPALARRLRAPHGVAKQTSRRTAALVLSVALAIAACANLLPALLVVPLLVIAAAIAGTIKLVQMSWRDCP